MKHNQLLEIDLRNQAEVLRAYAMNGIDTPSKIICIRTANTMERAADLMQMNRRSMQKCYQCHRFDLDADLHDEICDACILGEYISNDAKEAEG